MLPSPYFHHFSWISASVFSAAPNQPGATVQRARVQFRVRCRKTTAFWEEADRRARDLLLLLSRIRNDPCLSKLSGFCRVAVHSKPDLPHPYGPRNGPNVIQSVLTSNETPGDQSGLENIRVLAQARQTHDKELDMAFGTLFPRILTFVVTLYASSVIATGGASAQTGGFPYKPFASTSSATSSGGSGGGFFSFGGPGGKSSHAFSKKYRPGQIIVSFGDRRLYHITSRGRAVSYPIAVPRAQSRWSGVQYVSRKAVNPSWTPTPRMRRENPKLPITIPGGHPRNPMGVRALYLGSTMYRIHGTDAPWTIGKNVSKGCIRMHNSHVIDLYKKIRVGTKVTATWKRYRS